MTTFYGRPIEDQEGIGALTPHGLLDEVVASHGTRDALAFHGANDVVHWTYDDLQRESRRVARALLRHGVVKGARVAVLMGNRPEFIASMFGVAMAGGVLVPISTFSAPPELEHILRHSDTSVLLTQEHLLSHAYIETLASLCPELLNAAPGALRSPRFPFLRTVVSIGSTSQGAVLSMESFLGSADEVPEELATAAAAEVTPSDDGVVVYTSGTTALPKGVLHAHRSLAMQAWRLSRFLALDCDSRVWEAMPLFWTGGLSMGTAALAAGACLVLQEYLDAGETLRLYEVERVTTALAKAHQFAELEDHPDWARRDLSALRDADPFTSLARHPSITFEPTWSNRAAYGLSETMSHLSCTAADAPAHERAGHYGEILPGIILRILDPETGASVGIGEQGEIAVKGYTLTKGYLKTPPEEVFDEEGFFHTGDSGFVDERNRLTFSGRSSQLIKTSGANVSPLEVENELLQLPSVREAWVIGAPDEERGEVVVACIVPHEGTTIDEAGVRDHLRDRLASYKIPRRVLLISEDELTMTGNAAKPRADALRALVERRLS